MRYYRLLVYKVNFDIRCQDHCQSNESKTYFWLDNTFFVLISSDKKYYYIFNYKQEGHYKLNIL